MFTTLVRIHAEQFEDFKAINIAEDRTMYTNVATIGQYRIVLIHADQKKTMQRIADAMVDKKIIPCSDLNMEYSELYVEFPIDIHNTETVKLASESCSCIFYELHNKYVIFGVLEEDLNDATDMLCIPRQTIQKHVIV